MLLEFLLVLLVLLVRLRPCKVLVLSGDVIVPVSGAGPVRSTAAHPSGAIAAIATAWLMVLRDLELVLLLSLVQGLLVLLV